MFSRWKDRERTRFFRMGVIAAEIRNTLRNKSSDRYWTADDFIPQLFEEPVKQMDVQESVNYIASLNLIFGGEDLREQAIG